MADDEPPQRRQRGGRKAPEQIAAQRAVREAEKLAKDAKRLADFKAARDRLRQDCAVARGETKRFYPIFSPNWVGDMRLSEDEKPSADQKPIHQDRLIWFYKNQNRLSLYDQLAKLIDHDPTDQDYILRRYLGDYCYFRYAAVGRDRAEYVKGTMRIEDRNGRPEFSHWSHDLDPDVDQPAHRGYVYRIDSNLFFAGRAHGVMRLSIARTMRGTPAGDYMPGLVLSMRSSTRDPFAARFIMVSEKNKDLLAKLDPDLGGHAKFEELAKANEELHYMLLDLKDRQRRGE